MDLMVAYRSGTCTHGTEAHARPEPIHEQDRRVAESDL